MICNQCNSALPDGAVFCHACGARQLAAAALPDATADMAADRCVVQFVEVKSKWSLFGKEVCEFRACRETGEVVLASEQITLSGFEYTGPNERNKTHKRAFDKLVAQLQQQGWRLADDSPQPWYAASFWR